MASNPVDLARALRMVDANLNRAAEGMRVLEDIARLVLNDGPTSARLKTIRHRLVHTSPTFQRALIQARDASGDVGRDNAVSGERKTRDVQAVLVANARRVQESMRVLEELAKLDGIAGELDAAAIMKSRFEIYAVQQDMMAALTAVLTAALAQENARPNAEAIKDKGR
jgi:thiamine-phosphate pyrophosphorylase